MKVILNPMTDSTSVIKRRMLFIVLKNIFINQPHYMSNSPFE